MSIQINYKNTIPKKNLHNSVFFLDEKFEIDSLKRHISKSDYLFVLDLLKIKDKKKQIISFDINAKKKIILVSIKKNSKVSEIENLGAKFYDKFRENKILNIYSDAGIIISNIFLGHFLHGLKLKSYSFEKYKTKKNKTNISINVVGKNKTTLKNQIKFKAVEEGTFFARDLVSEPGNILHPDEYAKRLGTLSKLGLKVNIYDEKKIKEIRYEYSAWCWTGKYKRIILSNNGMEGT